MATKAEDTTDTEELIPVDTPPADNDAGDTDPPEDADEEDSRLSGKDDDVEEAEDDGFAINEKRARRRRSSKERRDAEKRARERDALEKQFLRQTIDDLTSRLGRVEGIAISSNEANLDQRISQTEHEYRTATSVMAKAMEAGNSDDFATALEIRDAARDTLNQLRFAKQQTAAVRNQPEQQRADPRVEHFRNRWTSDNADWFNKPGYEEDTQIAKAVDQAVVRDGYDPATEDYWLELNRRLANRLGPADTVQAPPRRQPPPQGRTREHVPPGAGQREVYVTPERKQAMIDAGMWDDPVKRTRMLKAYMEHDKNQTAR